VVRVIRWKPDPAFHHIKTSKARLIVALFVFGELSLPRSLQLLAATVARYEKMAYSLWGKIGLKICGFRHTQSDEQNCVLELAEI
jgi:hypothetical protein